MKLKMKCQVICTYPCKPYSYLFQNSCPSYKTGGMEKIVRAMLVSWKEREERSGREGVAKKK
jgi:hypothetical protein